MTDLSTVPQEDLAAELARRAAAQALEAAQAVALRYGAARPIFEGGSYTLPALSEALKAVVVTWPSGRLSVNADVLARQIDAVVSVWAADVAPQLALADAADSPTEEA
ncbi:hypothetical protein SGCZBJ_03880 [Caulobacter zeae]|uniref:Uncharacterized protein n=1 Tax=Caulobacter zeae TaxID=2055137 RepID=A0A2N5DQ20_9CAUL|nr:hypothetical protein [Caulobacter zeae]PLR28157.1 hypothetical protein SGCZBJ_03880 [Caulobacter zeae]